MWKVNWPHNGRWTKITEKHQIFLIGILGSFTHTYAQEQTCYLFKCIYKKESQTNIYLLWKDDGITGQLNIWDLFIIISLPNCFMLFNRQHYRNIHIV